MKLGAAKNLSASVRDNAAMNRFELEVDGHLAIAEYDLDGDVITFTHTEAPPALQGRGVASELIRGALLSARDKGLKARATCAYVVAYLQRHPEFAGPTG